MSILLSTSTSTSTTVLVQQRDEQSAANSVAAINFIEDIDISMIRSRSNHEHRRL